MKHKDIKITLKHYVIMDTETYRIVKLVGAITVDSRKRTNLTVGETLNPAEARELVPFYSVTVIQ
jgi:hypothetical protein